MDQPQLVFVKLGGSLITDKKAAMTPRKDVIQSLASELAAAVNASPGLRLLIGHGSGSFGHEVANRYQTQSGGVGEAYWQGFSQVWAAAHELNQIVIQALSQAGLPVMAFPPSAGIITRDQVIQSWNTQPIELALYHGLIPVVYGDVIFDTRLGGTILSTEAVFQHLARVLSPAKILLAGLDTGVYLDEQHIEQIVEEITPATMQAILPALSTSAAVDVTGGMRSKVSMMVSLVSENPALKVHIFSGLEPGNLREALSTQTPQFGTRIQH
jgi:isopentenyl phosphate kinase